jgi:hypothetical protein
MKAVLSRVVWGGLVMPAQSKRIQSASNGMNRRKPAGFLESHADRKPMLPIATLFELQTLTT